MGLAILGLLEDLGEVLTPSVVDLLVVALLGLLLRFLAAPPQPMPEDRADMFDVIGDPPMAVDHLGDPLGRPQDVGPAVVGRPLEQEGFQLGQLLVSESDLGREMRPGSQPLGIGLGHLLPAVE